MVYVKNHVSKALMAFISVCVFVFNHSVCYAGYTPNIAHAYIYTIDFGYDATNTDYHQYWYVTSTVPVVFYETSSNDMEFMLTEKGSAFSEMYMTKLNGDRAGGTSATITDKEKYYIQGHFWNNDESNIENIENCSGNVLVFSSKDAAIKYIDSGDESGVVIKPAEPVPDWNTAETKTAYFIKGFYASFYEDSFLGAWDDVCFYKRGGKSEASVENGYIRIALGFTSTGGSPRLSVGTSGIRGEYYKISDKGFQIPLDDITIPEGHYLSYVRAYPYVLIDVGGETKMYRGQSTIVYLDEAGVVTGVDNLSPEDEYDEENVEYSIWESVTNFFSDFWGNLMDGLYDLFVPDSEEILVYFEELNSWFSDRLGFIWYPFDLAIQLVAALAGGEADSMFKLPAAQLNIMGETYTIWEAQEIDMDPIGIFVYVRYFTSTLLVSGVVRLAINKWDDWIGGRAKWS